MMNVYDTANRLAGEIKESEEYVNYKMARQALALNLDLKKKIGEFEVARYNAQLTQMQTGKEDEEKTNKMKELYAELIQIEEAKKSDSGISVGINWLDSLVSRALSI